MTDAVKNPATANGGASWKGRRANRLAPSSREIKMLRPICQTCEDEAGGVKYLAPGWWNACEHDPYVSYAETKVTRPVYEDGPGGEKLLVRTEVVITTKPVPNWTSRTQAAGFSSGKAPQMALLEGCIYPQQLRSPTWPKGIKRRCQFRDCFEDKGLVKYNSGWFCREIEAKMVRVSDMEEPLRIGQTSRKADKLREQQLERVAV